MDNSALIPWLWCVFAFVAILLASGWIALRARRANLNPNAGPLEFSEWPPPKIERLLKKGVEQGLWHADLWKRSIVLALADTVPQPWPGEPLAGEIAAVPGADVTLVITDATDSSAPRLGSFGMAVTELAVSNCHITDAGLEFLLMLPNLEDLDLSDLPITGSGLAALSQLGRLKRLDLSRTQITDDSVRRLEPLTGLEQLAVYETSLTDACLDTLARLPRLRILEFTGSGITFERFRETLPRVALGP